LRGEIGFQDADVAADGSLRARAGTPPTEPAGGILHGAALLEDGRPLGWGRNGVGHVHDGTNADRQAPTLATRLVGARTVVAGGHHVLAG
jgi:hypothetical protein